MTEIEAGAVCIPNIGPAQRRYRLRFGRRLLLVALASWAALVALHVPWPWHLGLWPILAAGFTSMLQSREKT